MPDGRSFDPRQQAAWSSFLFDQAPEALFLLNTQGRLLQANPRFADLLGRPPEALAPLHLWDWDLDLPEPQALALLGGDGPPPSTLQHRWQTRDAEPLLVELQLERRQIGDDWFVFGRGRDITHRRAAELALHTSEQRLGLALSAAGMGVWDWDIASRRLHISPEVWAIVGRAVPQGEAAQLSAARLLQALHPDDRNLVVETAQRAVLQRQPLALECRYIGPDKRVQWLSGTGLLQRDAAGEPLRLIGTVQDITARKQAEAALRASQQRLALALTASRMGVWEWVLDETQVHFSREVFEMLGLPPPSPDGGEMPFGGLADQLHPEDVDRMMRAIREGLEGSGEFVVELRLSDGQGGQRWLEDRGRLERDARGTPWRMVGTLRDVTERKRTETALRESERRLSLALQASAMGVWEWDLDQRRVSWSAHSERILGHEPGDGQVFECSEDEMLSFVHHDDVATLLAARDAALQPGGSYEVEVRRFGYDGVQRWMRERGRVERDADGRPLRLLGTLQDVTEQHRLQQRLHDDASRRQVMIAQSPDGVVVINPDGSVDEANAAFADMLGYSREEVGRLHIWDWDRGFVRSELEALIADVDRPARTLLVEMCRKDGGLRQVEVSSSRLQLSGRSVHFCVCRDVTERQRVADALRESEARYRATFDNSAVGIAENALDGRWISANPRLCEITGYTHDELMALDFRRLTHPDDLPEDQAGIQRVLAGALVSVQAERRYLRRDGSTIWVARTTSLVRGADGRPRYFVSVIEDITHRKRIEAELAQHRQHLEHEVALRTTELQQAMRARMESEHFLRSIADNLPDMVGYWDAGRVLRFANHAYRDWFGRGREVVGLHRSELVGEPAADAGEPAFADALAGQARHFEYALSSDTGEVRYTWIHFVPDRQPEGVVGVFVLVSDISEVKQAELRLQALNDQLVAARDRAEQANRAKSAFLANMSHEIRTPMNAIIGLTHLMQRDMRDPLAVERLGKVTDAAHHLLDVINDVLDLSKIESGKLRLEQTDFPVDAVLSRACALVAERARSKGLELVVQSEGVPPLLRGDPTRLSQALLNLMSNAVKFTDRGAVVLRCVLEEADADALRLRFSVRDSGVGVPPDKLDKLFNAFEQADTSTTRRFGGTGLGLAITRRLALLMGGDVGADSVLGQGSCFWFTARFERAHATAPAALGNTVSGSLWGRRALVVDDQPDARAALADMLRRLGLQVDSAASGADALQQVQLAGRAQRPYELLLLDEHMPGLDGCATLVRLRQQLGTTLPPSLLITDGDIGRSGAQLRSAGFDGVLGKPVTLSGLHGSIARLAGERPASPLRRPPQAHEAALRQQHAGARVLLAEDNPINQEVASELLRAVGLRVDLAATGEQAVQLARDGAYDLVLMDMQMPEMDGLAATRVLRSLPAYAHTPILAMTANAFGDDRQACLDAGMDDHLAKPVDPELLYAMLGRWLPAQADCSAQAAATPPPPRQDALVAAPPPPLVSAAVPAAAPAAEPDQAPDFSGIPGLTMARALLYLPGRDQVFARVLRQFVANYADGLPGLPQALAAGDWGQARQQLHSLRGACGAVGAITLMAQAQALEQRLEPLPGTTAPAVPAATLQAEAQALQQAQRTLVAAIGQRLQPRGAPPDAGVDLTALAAAMDQLAELLRVADFSAGARHRAIEPQLRTAFSEAAARGVEQPLRTHDYDAALQALQGLRLDLARRIDAQRAAASGGNQ